MDERREESMATDPCDGCGKSVKIAGGIENLWLFEGDESGGLTLELQDGTSHFLCYECISLLPDDPTADNVGELGQRKR